MAFNWQNAISYGPLAGFLGNEDPSGDAIKYIGQIPGRVKPYLDPYMEAGKRAIPQLEGQYGNLMNDPGGFINKIGAGYKESPGFKFALERALAGGGRAAAAGGMAGSPTHEFENMQTASGLASQDYNQWLQSALSQYGLGLRGEEDLEHGGLSAGKSLADMIAQVLAQQGNLAYKAASDKNASQNSLLSGIGSAIGLFM